jgi:hypothetical protein
MALEGMSLGIPELLSLVQMKFRLAALAIRKLQFAFVTMDIHATAR